MSQMGMIFLHLDCPKKPDGQRPKMQLEQVEPELLRLTCPVCGAAWDATFTPVKGT